MAPLGARIRRGDVTSWLTFLLLAAVLFLVTPDARTNPFDGPMLIARRILHGEPYLPDGVTWIESFEHDGRRYIAYPPMATFILVPFAALTGDALGQTVANSLLIFGSALLVHALLRRLPGLERYADLGAIAWVLGTPLLYSARFGTTWLLMHSEGNFFFLLALLLCVARRSFFWAGLAFAVAGLTRYAILFSAPAFVLLATLGVQGRPAPRDAVRALVAFGAGATVPLALVLVYNALVFGDPLTNAYTASWFQKPSSRGERSWLERLFAYRSFRLENVPRNALFYLTAHPRLTPGFPWLRFTGGGESLLLLSPFLAGAFVPNLRLRFVRYALAGLVPMLLFYLMFSYQGYLQFGSRYLTDLLPLLLPVALSAFARSSPRPGPLVVGLVVVAIAFNAYGTWVVSRYGHS